MCVVTDLVESLEDGCVDGAHVGGRRLPGLHDLLQPLLARLAPHPLRVTPLHTQNTQNIVTTVGKLRVQCIADILETSAPLKWMEMQVYHSLSILAKETFMTESNLPIFLDSDQSGRIHCTSALRTGICVELFRVNDCDEFEHVYLH